MKIFFKIGEWWNYGTANNKNSQYYWRAKKNVDLWVFYYILNDWKINIYIFSFLLFSSIGRFCYLLFDSFTIVIRRLVIFALSLFSLFSYLLYTFFCPSVILRSVIWPLVIRRWVIHVSISWRLVSRRLVTQSK
jgi:hypothetical protein